MNNTEIRRKIDENNKLIKDLMSPNVFILNNTIADLIKDNQKLQEQCIHKFDDGYCIYCDKEEEDKNSVR